MANDRARGSTAHPIAEPTRKIAKEMREQLAARGMTRVELSRASGIPLKTMEKLLRGEVVITAERQWAIARALGTTMGALCVQADALAEIYDQDGMPNPDVVGGVPESPEHIATLLPPDESPDAG